MNRYQEVLSRAKEAHNIQAVVKFKFGKQIEGTRLTPLWWVSGKRRTVNSRGWNVATEKERRQHRGVNNNKSKRRGGKPVVVDTSKPLCKSLYMFRCECGTRKEIRYGCIIRADGKLARNHTKSCGCLQKEKIKLVKKLSKEFFHCLRDSKGRFKKKPTWDGNNT